MAFYPYISSKNKVADEIGPLKLDGCTVDDPKKIAEIFNNHSTSVVGSDVDELEVSDYDIPVDHVSANGVPWVLSGLEDKLSKAACFKLADKNAKEQ